MNASRGDFAQPEASAGGTGRTGAMKDQCSSYFAPSVIQRRSSASSAGLTDLCDSGGGMTSSGSLFRMRAMSGDLSGSPLMMTTSPLLAGVKANSGRSRRRPDLRVLESGPWQW